MIMINYIYEALLNTLLQSAWHSSRDLKPIEKKSNQQEKQYLKKKKILLSNSKETFEGKQV